MLRVVLDTQVILRGSTSASPTVTAKIYEAWDAGRFTLLLSEPILNEIEDLVSRPEVRRRLRMTPVEAGALIELLRRRGASADDKFLGAPRSCGTSWSVGSRSSPAQRLASTSSPGGGGSDGSWWEPSVQFRW